MQRRRLALIVAVDRYDDPNLGRLAAPSADAEALADVLSDPGLGGFEVSVLHNATYAETRERIDDLLAERGRDDLVLLHFSCHGIKDANGELMLAASNTTNRRLASTGIEAAWVSRQMRRSRAGSVVLLLDCCFGGAFERGMIARTARVSAVDVVDQFPMGHLEQGRGRAIITASTATEYAFEGEQLVDGSAPRPSIFTNALVHGIRTGEADRDRDGFISIGEMYEYVYDQVRQRTADQTPSKWEFGVQGGFYVARSRMRQQVPSVLSPGLLDLVSHTEPAGRIGAVTELTDLMVGPDSSVAAEARRVLTGLCDDGVPRVAAAAASALAEAKLTAVPAGAGTAADMTAGTTPDLQKVVEDMKQFEREYRTRVRAFLEREFRDLDLIAQQPGKLEGDGAELVMLGAHLDQHDLRFNEYLERQLTVLNSDRYECGTPTLWESAEVTNLRDLIRRYRKSLSQTLQDLRSSGPHVTPDLPERGRGRAAAQQYVNAYRHSIRQYFERQWSVLFDEPPPGR
ncbi:caspase family protein [Micromonospora sp. B9E7]|uniref:caspase family protein n=1 Tax=Micromonospora sp. B9E7 TaxID=3153574 RepID=UPI00325EAAC4